MSKFVLVLVSSVLLALPAAAKNDGFNGKWVIDKGSSSANFEIPDNLTQQIKTKGSDLVILTTWREPANGIAPLGMLGVMTTNLKLSLDGQEQTDNIGPFKQVSKTSQNANEIVTDYNAVVNGEQVTGHWTRTLSDDGREMTLQIDQKSGSQNNQAKLVFHRK